MKNLLLFLLLFAISCSQPNLEVQEEIQKLKAEITALKTQNEAAQKAETGFIHSVFFWVNEGITEEQKADFAKNGLGALSAIESVHKMYVGPPAMTQREVVDNSYGFALICHFKDEAAHDAYQDDPIHLKFIEDYKHIWSKVVVYDNLVIE